MPIISPIIRTTHSESSYYGSAFPHGRHSGSRTFTFPGGKRHPHQRRIPLHVLQAANSRLQAINQRLGKAKSFAELHGLIAQQIGPIPGIGDLTVYDIAHRIGAYLSLAPEAIYLHAGTREGAQALNLTGEMIALSQVPAELKLTPAEIEDCFCIYKDALRRGSLSLRPHARC